MKNRRSQICVFTPDGIVPMNKYKAVLTGVVLPILIACAAIFGAMQLHPGF